MTKNNNGSLTNKVPKTFWERDPMKSNLQSKLQK